MVKEFFLHKTSAPPKFGVAPVLGDESSLSGLAISGSVIPSFPIFVSQ